MSQNDQQDIRKLREAASGCLSPLDLRHTERVVALCGEFAGENSSAPLNLPLLIKAAWIHDVAKRGAGSKHAEPTRVIAALAEASPELAHDFMDWEERERILTIVASHKGAFEPSCCELESAVLRVCDKLDKYQKAEDRYRAAKSEYELARETYAKDDPRRVKAKKKLREAEKKLSLGAAAVEESCAKSLLRIEQSGLLSDGDCRRVARFVRGRLPNP